MIEIKELNSDNALSLPLILNDSNITNPFIIITNLKWVQPFGMLLTSKVIRDFRSSHPEVSFKLDFNDSTSGHSYASHMGFYKSISDKLEIGKKPGEASGSNTYIPITEIDLLKFHQEEVQRGNYNELGESIEKEASKLSKILARTNVEFEKLLTYLIREILRNIPEHSGSTTAWICGQNWNDGNAEIAIIDGGIGVKSSLQNNDTHRKYILTDKDAIICALKPGISKAFAPERGNKSSAVWSNSGFGLYMVSEICIRLGGSFNLASGEQFVKIDNSGAIEVGKTCIAGTAIKINLNSSNLNIPSKDLIRQVAKDGEKRAKQIKNAFKEASIPSKGLIEEL